MDVSNNACVIYIYIYRERERERERERGGERRAGSNVLICMGTVPSMHSQSPQH